MYFSMYTLVPVFIRKKGYFPKHPGPTSREVVLRSKLVDGRCRVQFPFLRVGLAVRCFPWISPKFAKVRVMIPQKDPHGRHAIFSPRFHKRTVETTTTTKTSCGLSYGIIRISFNLCRKCFQMTSRFGTILTAISCSL